MDRLTVLSQRVSSAFGCRCALFLDTKVLILENAEKTRLVSVWAEEPGMYVVAWYKVRSDWVGEEELDGVIDSVLHP